MVKDTFNIKKNVLTGIVLFALCGAYAWLSQLKMVQCVTVDCPHMTRESDDDFCPRCRYWNEHFTDEEFNAIFAPQQVA